MSQILSRRDLDFLLFEWLAVEDLLEHMPGLSTALTETATAMGLTADEATLAKLATGELRPVFDDATGAITGYTTA